MTPEQEGDDKGKHKVVGYSEEVIFQGPLPHPEFVDRYEQTMPGAADRIFTMAEKEQQERHRQSRWNLLLFQGGRMLGLIFAFLLAAGIIGGGIFLLYHDKSITGMATLLTGVAGLVGSFIYRDKGKKRDESKNEKTK